MKRRSFLTALIACAAPAVVRASSLMPIIVPSRDLLTGSYDYLPLAQMSDFSLDGDFTFEMWRKPTKEEFLNITTVRQNGSLLTYVNGEIVPSTESVFRTNDSGFYLEIRL